MWAIKYNQCKNCRSSSVPHKALGLCKNCYEKSKGYLWQKKYQKDNREKVNKYQREYAKIAYRLGKWKRKKPILLKQLIQRDGEKCKKCGTKENLTIEHIKPRCIGGKNHLDNLEILCLRCNLSSYNELVKTALKFYFENSDAIV